MPRKSDKQIRSEGNLINYFKWQFLRRNKSYIEDYDAFIKHYEDVKCSLNESDENDWIMNQDRIFEERWGIDRPIDYRKVQLDKYEGFTNSYPVKIVRKVHFTRSDGTRYEEYDFKPSGIPQNGQTSMKLIPERVLIGVDLNFSKTVIKGLINGLIDDLYEQRRPLDKEKKNSRNRGTREFNGKSYYNEILEIWDYVEKHKDKMTWARMASKLYKKGTISEHNLRQKYYSCQSLIDGGYLKLK